VSTGPGFPKHLRLNQPGRREQLTQEFYEQHHKNRSYDAAKDQHLKIGFFRQMLQELKVDPQALGIDLGCRGGALTREVNMIRWAGVDIDRIGLERANAIGIPAEEMDISVAIDFADESFDVAMLTEVLEHLPFPSITVREVHRILKKEAGTGIFFGTVPLDYNIRRRWGVLRGKRLTADPTHLHHFSFNELDTLLRHYFEQVKYCPTRGAAARHPSWNLSLQHWVHDIAWAAWSPKRSVSPWQIRVIL
jgi:SAM-dependent methyltransferase